MGEKSLNLSILKFFLKVKMDVIIMFLILNTFTFLFPTGNYCKISIILQVMCN